jgi:hypothetical protein
MRSDDYDPEKWDVTWTNPAFAAMTDADAYWAAKIVASFSNDHILAAVGTGGLPSRELERKLAGVIATRRDKIVRYWFGKVSTIEEPVVARQGDGSLRLSFRDLGLEHGAWGAGETVYDWRFEDPARGRRGSGSSQPRTGADQLLEVAWTGPGGQASDGELAVLELVTRRPGLAPAPARVFLRWNGRGYQVVGLTHGDPER